MIYITGDVHGNLKDLKNRIYKNKISDKDTLIVLGDMGLNFFLDLKDYVFKSKVNSLGPTIFTIRGNHEARPEKIANYKKKTWNGAEVYFEEEFPNILFAIDGNVYNIENKSFLVLGGAYSVDKYYRAFNYFCRRVGIITESMFEKITKLAEGQNISKLEKKEIDDLLNECDYGDMGWFKDEQLSEEEKKKIFKKIKGKSFDIILSHTTPYSFQPTEMFLSSVNQDMVDNTQEYWLDVVEKNIEYKKWYAGHFHTNKSVNEKFKLLFGDVEALSV